MDAVVLWEEMLTEMNRADVDDQSVRTIGRWLNNYQRDHGICETRQLAIELAEPADDMWRMFEPAHSCDRPFDFEWAPAWLLALHEIGNGLSVTARWAHIVAGIIASYGIDTEDDEEMSDHFHSLRSFHTEHKMSYRDPNDGKMYVCDNDPDDPDALERFWGVYGLNPEGFAMHVVDVQTEAQAREVIAALNFWLKRKTYDIVEELPNGTDNVLVRGLELEDAELCLVRWIERGHNAYLQDVGGVL